METMKNILEKVKTLGDRACIGTPVHQEEILFVEKQLMVKLPLDYVDFLLTCGGLGIGESSISGILSGDVKNINAGTVYGDTVRCRNEFSLPQNLVVILFEYEEVCWCLDTGHTNSNSRCPVVSWSLFQKKIDGEISPDFYSFLKEYVDLRLRGA